MTGATRILLAAVLVSGSSACASISAGTDADVRAVLAQFPPCEPPVGSGVDAGDVEGLVLPQDAVITSVVSNGPVTDIAAYVPRTPLDVRAFYEAESDVEILQLEDEIFETEVLLANGDLRMYLIAKVACPEGSHITAFVAPASAATTLPTLPGGAP